MTCATRGREDHYRCDRCGNVAITGRFEGMPQGWTSLAWNAHVGSVDRDLCDTCVKSLLRWFGKAKEGA